MNMDKNLTELVSRLERLFPDIVFYNEGYYFDGYENEYAIPSFMNWFDIIESLKKEGVEIKKRTKDQIPNVKNINTKLKKIFPHLLDYDNINDPDDPYFNWTELIEQLYENGLEFKINNL